jgi:hypothetical protein
MSDDDLFAAAADPDEEGEVILDGGDADCVLIPDTADLDAKISGLHVTVHNCSAWIYDCEVSLLGNVTIVIDLKRDFLPLSMQAVYGFLVDPVLLHIEFDLDNFCWDLPPAKIEFLHPKLGTRFVGQPLIATVVRSYFSQFYQPRTNFRSAPCILVRQGTPILSEVAKLAERGFNGPRAARSSCARTKSSRRPRF